MTTRNRSGPRRHQSLQDALDWSYTLLTPDEQTLFARLGIFVGGFTLNSAEAICNSDGALDVFAGIETLLRSSLLRQVESPDDEPRFDMLLTIRDYALEKIFGGGLPDVHDLLYIRPEIQIWKRKSTNSSITSPTFGNASFSRLAA